MIGRAAEKVGTGFSLRPHDQPKNLQLGGGAFSPFLIRSAPSRCSSREHPTHGPDPRWFGPFLCARKNTTFLQITISVIRVASCRRRSGTLVGMMGTLAGKPVGTVGAIGCVLQPEKGPVASSSEQRKHDWMWRETVLSVRTAFGGLRTFPPMDSMPANKGGPGAIA